MTARDDDPGGSRSDHGEPEDDAAADAATDDRPNVEDGVRYNPHKPLWWKKKSGRPTKAQKRAIRALQSRRLPPLEWGSVLDWDALFPDAGGAKREIWLEIGFGTGDNLLALAHRHPNRCLVGAEVHTAGIGKLCHRIQEAVQRNRHWTDYQEFVPEPDKCTTEEVGSSPRELYSNLRFYGGDGVKLLPYIPNDSLTAILVTFPDPFPKERDAEYRLIQTQTLVEFHRVLDKSNDDDDSTTKACLFVATDHEGYFQWCHQVVHQVNQQRGGLFSLVQDVPRNEWLPVISKYEQKGWNEGRTTHWSCWRALNKIESVT